MQRNTNRILTTHCGSLARPKDLLDLMKAKVNGEPYDDKAFSHRVQNAVAEVVRKQAESGVDIVTDGEQGKPGFFAYVRERLAGFEPKGAERGARRSRRRGVRRTQCCNERPGTQGVVRRVHATWLRAHSSQRELRAGACGRR